MGRKAIPPEENKPDFEGERREFTDEEKATFLANAPLFPSLRAACRAFGVSYWTAYKWRNEQNISPDAIALGKEKKSILAEKLEAFAHEAADALSEKVEDAGLKDTSIAMGIALDKARDLMGIGKDEMIYIQELQAILLKLDISFAVFMRATIDKLELAYRVRQQQSALPPSVTIEE